MRKATVLSPGATQAIMLPIDDIGNPPANPPGNLPETPQGTNVAPTKPFLSSSAIKWTWSKSGISEVRYNPAIQAWIDFSPDFANWVRSSIMLHADNGLDETRCSIPDQWRADIGESITIVTSNCIPGRQGNEFKAGVYTVMN